ncbi:hypothetical protein AVEN_90974-1, partial [Araneus ventricosus]
HYFRSVYVLLIPAIWVFGDEGGRHAKREVYFPSATSSELFTSILSEVKANSAWESPHMTGVPGTVLVCLTVRRHRGPLRLHWPGCVVDIKKLRTMIRKDLFFLPLFLSCFCPSLTAWRLCRAGCARVGGQRTY